MDGNFKAEHLKMRAPEDDVVLADGAGFMVGQDDYAEHVRTAKEYKEVRRNHLGPPAELNQTQETTCHEHNAVVRTEAECKPLRATGIGATACARHGFFVPHSVVDFQKGERYENSV